MKENKSATSISVTVASISNNSGRKQSYEFGIFGKSRYKFWAFAAILLLAFWSLFTGSVTLKSSITNLSHFSDDIEDFPNYDNLDILEVEEREKVVRHMWDVYIHSKNPRLPRFWQQAFKAAYVQLVSDVPAVRDAAVSEIAKMSISSSILDPHPPAKAKLKDQQKWLKLAEKSSETARFGNS